MGKVALIGLEFFGRHGVFSEETRLGARFVVDVELEFNFEGITDSLENTVDYGSIYTRVASEVTGQRYDLIEYLAQALAEKLLLEHPRTEKLTVRVHKPHAPLPGVFRDVYAEVTKQRGE
ncbi:MAG: dihydroneopterin aldolase [Pseudopedobacter sp.]|nr:dihydroneopterin aldolase [Deinococcales bacterium]